MNQLLEQIIKKTPLYPLPGWVVRRRQNWAVRRRQVKELAEWERNGKPVPPPHLFKQRTLQSYSKRYGLKILVETGTYYGEMVEAMKRVFDRIYSIELSKEPYEQAKERFKGDNRIVLIYGDSGIEIKNVMGKLDQPTLFWLDSHYSGGVTAKGFKTTPIYEELGHILESPDSGHVIIIDDARLFGTDPDYLSIQELSDFIKQKRPKLDIVVQDDSMRIAPRQ